MARLSESSSYRRSYLADWHEAETKAVTSVCPGEERPSSGWVGVQEKDRTAKRR